MRKSIGITLPFVIASVALSLACHHARPTEHLVDLTEVSGSTTARAIQQDLQEFERYKELLYQSETNSAYPSLHSLLDEAIFGVWSATTKQELVEAKLAASNAMAQLDLQAQVRFQTHRAGATIRYQLISSDYVHTALRQTNSAQLELIPVGIYYIWSERRKTPTSARRREFLVTRPNMLIELFEEGHE